MLPLRTMQPIAVTSQPLEMGRIVGLVSTSGGFGAIASFVGLVRNTNQNRVVTHLEYEAYEPLAVKALEQIRREAAEQWPGVALAVHHRIGRLEIGEASIVIAAASAHRADAFAVCRYVIERVKQIVPIWKHEFFEGGEVWIEGATANPADETARLEAVRRACGASSAAAALGTPCA
jgi:molybdopterin synthase catalytic subunit